MKLTEAKTRLAITFLLDISTVVAHQKKRINPNYM
jgi:hypothetical protein